MPAAAAAAADALPYAARPEWADVAPLAQYEGFSPLAPIFYTDEYRDATDYFRGIVRAGEMSARVLALTEHLIRLNPAHYSAWQYRYKTLIATKAPLETERRLMDELAVKHLKTYQVWHHRRLLILALRAEAEGAAPAATAAGATATATARELAFIARCLDVDTKNYHTWAYRQWLLAHCGDSDSDGGDGAGAGDGGAGLWANERAWVESMLERDVRNNSAWHHRFFVVFAAGVRAGDEDRAQVVRRELAYTKEAIAVAPNNASAWNYLRGVLDHARLDYGTLEAFVTPYAGTAAANLAADADADALDLENPLPAVGAQLPCAAAIEFLAEIYESQEGGTERAVALYKSLGDEHDTIRKKYWEHRIREALQEKAA